MSLKKLFDERSKKQAANVEKVTDTEALVKKMNTLENSLRALQKERDDWKGKFESFTGEVSKKTLQQKILEIAAAKNAVDPEDLLYRFESKVKQSEDGKLFIDGSEKTLDEDIQSFLESKPHLVKAPVVETAPSKASPFPATSKGAVTLDVKSEAGATAFARSFRPGGQKPQ